MSPKKKIVSDGQDEKVICDSRKPKLCKGCLHLKPHNRDEWKDHKDGFDSACDFNTCGVTGEYLPVKCIPVGDKE